MKRKFLQKILAVLIVFMWFFSGWPVIWKTPRFPPKIKEAQAAITFINDARLPVTNNQNITATNAAITPPSSMAAGDFILVYVAIRATGVTITNSNTGGQSWTAGIDSEGNSVSYRSFYAVYNGNWSANPAWSWGSTPYPYILWMLVFRGVNQSSPIDAAENIANFASPTNPYDVTIGASTITTQTNGAVVVAMWATPDNNSWALQSGGWNNPNGQAYWQSSGGSDSSVSIAYQEQAVAGGNSAVTNRQTSVGPDAGIRSIIALKPASVITVGNGAAEPSNTTIGPDGSITDLDNFTLVTNSGTDTVTGATVTLSPAGAYNNIAQVDITDTSNTAKCASVTNPASNIVTFTVCNIPVTTSETTYKIRITPKTHADMPAVPGASYATTGTVTDITYTTNKLLNDTGSATVTVDNASPGAVSGTSGTPSNQQVQLNWTNPGDGDFAGVVVLRRASSVVGDNPTEGVSYSVGNTIGSSTVACVEDSSSTSCTDTGLNNGVPYHYKIFTKDVWGNYDAGTVFTGSPFTPQLPISISITTDGTVAFGHLGIGASADSSADIQTVRVDSGPADLNIRSTNFSEGANTWTLNTTNGANQVKWEFSKDGTNWTTFAIANNLYTLDTNVPSSETRNIYFRLTMPTSTSSYNQFGSTVTIVASAP